jgi:hypothetical protein
VKPVVVLTVCRRYHELADALARLKALEHEFAEPPAVVVVWARPEVGRLWYFQRLLRDGTVHHLATRPALPGEADDRATSVPESHNIRLGLELARREYGPGAYAVVQAADVHPHATLAYAFVDAHMRAGAGAVVLHWQNGCVHHGIWHTNFFAARLDDEAYWPPVSDPGEQDVLERQWGRKLQDLRPPGVVESHNYNGKRFSHAHRSEHLPPWPVEPQAHAAGLSLLIGGRKARWRRLADWLGRAARRCIPFRRK